MLAVSDDDAKDAGQTGEMTSSRVGNDGHEEMRGAARHRAAVLKHERSGAAGERARDALDGDVRSRSLDSCVGSEHVSLARTFEVAVQRLADGHSRSWRRAASLARYRREFHFERAPGMTRHKRSLSGRCRGRLGWCLCSQRGGEEPNGKNGPAGSAHKDIHGLTHSLTEGFWLLLLGVWERLEIGSWRLEVGSC